MTLPAAPPRYASWSDMVSSIKYGEAGWRVYALQKAINSVRYDEIDHGDPSPWARVEPDGDFGADTLTAVKACQTYLGTTVDGAAGPTTQRLLLKALTGRTHDLLPGLPDGLMRGFCESEGANMLAATNWSVPGGVDCGAVQIRAYGPPYDMKVLLNVFDPMESLMQAANDFLGRAAFFYNAPWIATRGARRTELAMRTAVMAHNWPAGADAIGRYGICAAPNSLAGWVAPGTKFSDGAPVQTRWEWCQFYAMGGVHGEGSITKYVTSWA